MPSLGLSLGLSSEGSSFRASGYGQQILGFPLRIKAFNGGESYNLYRISYEQNDSVVYTSDNGMVSAFWVFTDNFGELTTDGGNSLFFSGPTLASVPTSWPSTGWDGGWQFGLSSPTLITLSYSSPQSFEYSNSIPSPAFTSSPAIASNMFTISGLSSTNVGSQNAVINLEKADYYLANSVTIPVTITKKNVTLSVNNQSSTYSPNGTYNWYNAVSVSTLSAGDTIQGRFNSNLLTGVPANNANAGSYTISFNPNYTSANYNITNSPASATWTINKASQTITFNPTNSALTTDSTSLSASSTSGLAVSFSVVSGPGSINGSTLTYSGAGSVVVRASQAGNQNYNPATNVDRTIVVSAPAGGGAGNLGSDISLNGSTAFGFTNSNAFIGEAGDTFYLGTGQVFVIYQGMNNTWPTIFVMAPNSSVLDNPSGFAWVQTSSNWKIFERYQDDGTSFRELASNPSTNANAVPTSGWVLSQDFGWVLNNVVNISALLPVSTSSIIVNGGRTGFENLSISKFAGSKTIWLLNGEVGNESSSTRYTFTERWRGYPSGNWNYYEEVSIGIFTRRFDTTQPSQNFGNPANYTYAFPFYAGNGIYDKTTASYSFPILPCWALFWLNADEYGPVGSTWARHDSTDFTNIPTNGWIVHNSNLTYNPLSITITAV